MQALDIIHLDNGTHVAAPDTDYICPHCAAKVVIVPKAQSVAVRCTHTGITASLLLVYGAQWRYLEGLPQEAFNALTASEAGQVVDKLIQQARH